MKINTNSSKIQNLGYTLSSLLQYVHESLGKATRQNKEIESNGGDKYLIFAEDMDLYFVIPVIVLIINMTEFFLNHHRNKTLGIVALIVNWHNLEIPRENS